MCTTNVYSLIYPDGRKETQRQPALCQHSRHGHPCPNNVVFKHPEQYVTYGAQFPPTPTYTPRTGTPIHHSGNESDRSGGYQSAASSSSRRSKRSSGAVYINGKKVYDLDNRGSSGSKERIVLVDGPPTPRTPPQSHAAPHTAPSSPSTPYIIDASHRRESSSSRRRPVIVDERQRRRTSSNAIPTTSERPRVQIEVVDAKPRGSSSRSKHHRNSSASSYESEEMLNRQREEREQRKQERRQKEYEDQRDARIRDRILAANAKIASRSAVPMTHQPLKRSSTSTTAATAGTYDYESELVDSVRGMGLSDKHSRRRERERQRQQEAENEALRQRLKERMMPKRRATVGPGSRRPRDAYGADIFRYE